MAFPDAEGPSRQRLSFMEIKKKFKFLRAGPGAVSEYICS